MSGKIFISYRRDDSRYQARMIYEAFLRRMPRENVFMDIDTIPLGVNFVKVLEGWVEQCEVLLVLMGPGWANSTDPKTGKRRLDNPKDFVRVEIRGALIRDIPVVPVMLDGAQIPDEDQLPDDIKGLLSRNAEFVEYRTFDADVQRLLKKLGVGGSAKQAAAPATIAGTQRAQAIEPSTLSSAEDLEIQGDLADKARERRTISKEWTKRWLTPIVGLTVLLAAALIGALFFWSPGPMSGKKADVAADSVERARQAAEVHAADAEKARQAAEAKAAEAMAAEVKSEQARQAAEAQAAEASAKAADADKARQAAEAKAAEATAAAADSARQAVAAKAADADKARQAAEAKAVDAEKARQAATAKAAEADKARQTAEAKAAEATDAVAKSAQARQAAEAQAADAEKARQEAEPKATGTVTTGPASPSSQFLRRSNAEAGGLQASSRHIAAVSSTVDCERICSESNTSCKVYTYNKSSKWCFMSSVDGFSVADLVPNENYDSGILATVTSGLTSLSGQFSQKSNMEAKGAPASTWVSVVSIIDCEQNCARSNTCKAYTYDKKTATCYGYSVADLSPNNNYDSGVRATVASGRFTLSSKMEANGVPASTFRVYARSVGECEQSCGRSNTCTVFSYDKNIGLCYMYSTADLVANERYDSGIRRQAAEAQAATSVPPPPTVTSGLASPSGQFSPRSNMEVRGPLAGILSANLASLGDCEQWCARAETWCKAFTYSKSRRMCYVYPSFTDLVVNNDFDSGVRN